MPTLFSVFWVFAARFGRTFAPATGIRYARTRGAPTILCMTRPLLDAVLRRRVRALRNLSFATRHDVEGLSGDRARNVIGVRLRSEAREAELQGKLVVDAMGRGSRARRWLAEMGHSEPPLTEVRVNVHYASRLFSRTAEDLRGDKLVLIAPTAELTRGGVAFAVEGDRWLVTLFAYGGLAPPTEIQQFKAFARSLVANDIADLLAQAAPLDDGASFAYPAASLRRFDELAALPDGYVSLGDSLCNLNPSYGQGISSAALQAEALAVALADGTQSLPHRYYKHAIKAVLQPFNLMWSADLDLPGVVAPPNPTPAPIRAYLRRAMRVASNDPAVALAIRRIIGLLDPPPVLLKPSMALRVLFGNAVVTEETGWPREVSAADPA